MSSSTYAVTNGQTATVTDTMSPVVDRVRAYFAPVNRAAHQATLFDPAQSGTFALDAPPAPWLDLGWIANFKRSSGSTIVPLRTGTPPATSLQARTAIDATVSFAFAGWGKLQLALAAGTQQLNLLTAVAGSVPAGSGAAAIAATPLLPGSTAMSLQVAPAAAVNFTVGQYVAVDIDNTGQTGFVGSGVSGAYLTAPLADVDYIRRITLNVARIASIDAPTGTLTLDTPLLAGAPVVAGASPMKVSAAVGLCDREGSSFFQEWSALFVADGRQGERICWHYPRLQTMSGIAEAPSAAPGGFERLRLSAAFRALPVKDAVDGETVVCFRSYVAA